MVGACQLWVYEILWFWKHYTFNLMHVVSCFIQISSIFIIPISEAQILTLGCWNNQDSLEISAESEKRHVLTASHIPLSKTLKGAPLQSYSLTTSHVSHLPLMSAWTSEATMQPKYYNLVTTPFELPLKRGWWMKKEKQWPYLPGYWTSLIVINFN